MKVYEFTVGIERDADGRYFQVEGEGVTILTVLHQRSDVALWSRHEGR